jgi:putative membrane protein
MNSHFSLRHSHGRRTATLASALLLSGLGIVATGQAVEPTTPSSKPRDRHDMVTSGDTRLNDVGKQPLADDRKEASRADRHFLQAAAKNGMEELKIARLAAADARDAGARAFATQLVNDHTRANQELSELADRKGVSLVDRDQQDRDFKNLVDEKGPKFDQKFIQHELDQHKEAIELYEKAARKSDDADIAAFAAKQLSVLQAHEQKARELAKTFERQGGS